MPQQDPWAEFRNPPQASAPVQNTDPIVRQAPQVNPVEVQREQVGLQRDRVALQQAQVELAQQQNQPAESGDISERETKVGQLRTLLEQIGRVEDLYRSNLQGGVVNAIAGRVPGMIRPENEQFTAASAGMAEQGLAAFRVPGVGAQSDNELRQFVEANRPLATDSDLAIEEKLRQLRNRVSITLDAWGIDPGQLQPPAASEGSRPPPMAGTGGNQPPAGSSPPSGPTPDLNGPLVNAEGQTAGRSRTGGDETVGQQIATDEYRREDDPALAGVRQEYARRLGEGQSTGQLLAYLRSAGVPMDADLSRSVNEQVQFRRDNPNVPVEEYDTSTLDDRMVRVPLQDRLAGYIADSPVGSYLINAGDAAAGFTLDNIVGMTGGNAEQARRAMAIASENNPISSIAGTVTGGTFAALAGEAGLARAGLTAALPRALAADTLYGAAAGAGASDYASDGSQASIGDRAMGAGMGAAAGLAGGYAGNKIGNALAGVARGTTDASVNALTREGVPLTAGQTYGNGGLVGRTVRGIEDRLAGIPVVGDAINARRAEGFRAFNSRAFDRALEPIGGTVGDKVGQEAVDEAQRQVSQAFTDALSGVGLVPDDAFRRDFSASLMGVRGLKRVGDEIFDDVVDVFRAYDSDQMLSGEALQTISRDLRDIKFAYRQDPRFNAIGKQIDRVERALFDMADRQASGTIPAYTKARQAYRRLATLEDAVMRAQNQADQMFTPAQLNRADTTSGRRLEGRRAAARGDTPFNDMAVAGQAVLPNRVPDSGTVGRFLVPAALVGGGASADAAGGNGVGTGLTIGAILAALYSRTGQRLLTKPGRGMQAGTRRRAVLESDKTRRAIGASGAASAAALTTTQR